MDDGSFVSDNKYKFTSLLLKYIGEKLYEISLHLSVRLSPPKLLGRIQPNLLHHFPSSHHDKDVCEHHYFSMHPLSIHPSFMQSPPKPLGGIQPNLPHHFSLMVRVCESNILFSYVHCPSICLCCYLLLNHWADFNQTCCMTSLHGKGVQKQVCLSFHQSCC